MDDDTHCTCAKCQHLDLIEDTAEGGYITEALEAALRAVAEAAANTVLQGETTTDHWHSYLASVFVTYLAFEDKHARENGDPAGRGPRDRIEPTAPSTETVQ